MRNVGLVLAAIICIASVAYGRPVPARTYKELLDASDLVLIVQAATTRQPRADDAIVPLEEVLVLMGEPESIRAIDGREMDRFTAVITEFDVLGIVKGTYDGDLLTICHYAYKADGQELGNGPAFVSFPTDNLTKVRGERWSGDVANDYLLFLKYDSRKRLTFVTGQYDPHYSVKQITSPLPHK
jgi:hypothetical protein